MTLEPTTILITARDDDGQITGELVTINPIWPVFKVEGE